MAAGYAPLALAVVATLSAADALTLSGIARAVDASPSAVQRALATLRDDRIVERRARSRYALTVTERTGLVAALAMDAIPVASAAAIGARANHTVAFVARESAALVVVFAGGSAAMEQAHAARFFKALGVRHALAVTYLDHDDVRRRLLGEPELRLRMARARILHGSLTRSFPDRSRHGIGPARPLHRPHRALHVPSTSTLRRLTRRHGVAKMALFGSAVRSDFRPDSDVDVLVHFNDGVRPTLRSQLHLEADLERAFARDVDVVRDGVLDPATRSRIDREAVPLW